MICWHFARGSLGLNVTESKVSIVIPTYNSAPLLARALRSVLDQTYSNWEAFVIDNHSSDNTDAVVASFQDVRICLLKTHNQGVIAKSRNIGIRQATGQWIAFLDADDWWTPEKLERSVVVLKAGADVVYHDLRRAGPRKSWSRRVIRSRRLQQPVFHDLYWNGNGLLNSSVVVSRKLLCAVDELSENPALVGAEDFECWLRLARQSDDFVKLPGIYGYYWIGTGNTSNPKRAITWLAELSKIQEGFESSQDISQTPPWMSFALAKANYELRQFDVARAEVGKLLREAAPLSMKTKAYCLQLLIWRSQW